MKQVTITVPQQLAVCFLEIAENCTDDMSNAGCNDFWVDDTPENKELIDLAQANDCKMTLDEYRASDEEYLVHNVHKGRICITDFVLFGLFVEQVKKSLDV